MDVLFGRAIPHFLLLYSIYLATKMLFYIHNWCDIYFYVYIYPMDLFCFGYLSYFRFLTVLQIESLDILVNAEAGCKYLFLLVICLWKQCMFMLSRYCQVVSKVIVPFYTPRNNGWGFHLLTALPTLGFVYLLKTLVFWQVCNDITLWFQFVLSWLLILLNTFPGGYGPLYIAFI